MILNYYDARMSFFRAPIKNCIPERDMTLFDVYNYVRGWEAQSRTICLRGLNDEKRESEFKKWNFDYVTPSCVCSYHNDNGIISHSGIICMDLDYLDNVESMRMWLTSDPYWGKETLLMFTSPRGNGVKWFLPIDTNRYDHRTWYKAIRQYLMHTYKLSEKQVDSTCENPSRACFLCQDENAYLNPVLLDLYNNKV